MVACSCTDFLLVLLHIRHKGRSGVNWRVQIYVAFNLKLRKFSAKTSSVDGQFMVVEKSFVLVIELNAPKNVGNRLIINCN